MTKPSKPHVHYWVAPAASDGVPPPDSESPLRPVTTFTCKGCSGTKELINSMRTLLSMQGTRFGNSTPPKMPAQELKQRRDAVKAGQRSYQIVSPTTKGAGSVWQ